MNVALAEVKAKAQLRQAIIKDDAFGRENLSVKITGNVKPESFKEGGGEVKKRNNSQFFNFNLNRGGVS